MTTVLLIATTVLWLVVLLLAFLLLGTLRSLGLLTWRLEQLEATTPSRIGRSGLKKGVKAPDFTLASVEGSDVALHDFAGRKVFLAFTQSGCGPCHQIMPELNKLQGKGEVQVLVVNNGEVEASRKWAAEVRARFPVLVQQRLSLSKRYEVLATPFAFLIDGRGAITSKGIINSGKHIGYVLSGAGDAERNGQAEPEPAAVEAGVS